MSKTNVAIHTETQTGENLFDPLLCFARSPNQTADDVFDMIQERMKTVIGVLIGIKKIQPGLFPSAEKELIDNFADWHGGDWWMTSKDFDKFAPVVGLSLADVFGRPRIKEGDIALIKKSMSQPCAEYVGGFDPVALYVVLGAFDRLDQMAVEHKCMQKAWRFASRYADLPEGEKEKARRLT